MRCLSVFSHSSSAELPRSFEWLLWEYLDETSGVSMTTTWELVYAVPVAGTFRAVVTRIIRNSRIVYMTDPAGVRRGLVVALAFVVFSVARPLLAALIATSGAWAAYRYLGIERWTWLLTWPSLLVSPVATVLGMVRQEFEWSDRRYRWRSKFDVCVLSSCETGEKRSEDTDTRNR